jgi:hypothetical protein
MGSLSCKCTFNSCTGRTVCALVTSQLMIIHMSSRYSNSALFIKVCFLESCFVCCGLTCPKVLFRTKEWRRKACGKVSYGQR